MRANRIFSDRDKVQLDMFRSIHKINLKAGMTHHDALMRAIVLSCDEEYEKAMKVNPHLIDRFLTRVPCNVRHCDMNSGGKSPKSRQCLSHDIECGDRILYKENK